MSIFYHKSTNTFHLTNGYISYVMKTLPNRGHSSHNHNPFIMLRRPGTTETSGPVPF